MSDAAVTIRVPVALVREWRLGKTGLQVYAVLVDHGGSLRTSEIATHMGVSVDAVRYGIASLEREGLVRQGFVRLPRTRQPASTWAAVVVDEAA